MISEDIIKIKNKILAVVGGDCEKIILFGSYAYGTPKEDSDYDFYVVLKDGAEKPILALQNMYGCLAGPDYKPVDLLANYKSRFEWRSALVVGTFLPKASLHPPGTKAGALRSTPRRGHSFGIDRFHPFVIALPVAERRVLRRNGNGDIIN